jgi:zinc/manganese transport system permease protein
LISFHSGLPSGPAIVLVASVFYIGSVLLGTHDSLRLRLMPPAHLRA